MHYTHIYKTHKNFESMTETSNIPKGCMNERTNLLNFLPNVLHHFLKRLSKASAFSSNSLKDSQPAWMQIIQSEALAAMPNQNKNSTRNVTFISNSQLHFVKFVWWFVFWASNDPHQKTAWWSSMTHWKGQQTFQWNFYNCVELWITFFEIRSIII